MLACGGSSKKNQSPEDKHATAHSKSIESNLKKDRESVSRVKMLLLGTGDAGKSTFTKQLGFIYGNASSEYINTFTFVLRDNCLSGMQLLLLHMRENGGIPNSITDIATQIKNSTDLDAETADAITKLYESKSVKDFLSKAQTANFQGGIEGAKFYFENAKRFAASNYVPTKEDVLMARRKTVGVVETHFEFQNTKFTLVDVGGQRSERKKWLHCFNQVTCVIYLTAINEYDMALEEDGTTNRLLESLKLWSALTSSHYFKGTPFILFLNKSDLFEEKIKTLPLSDIFADFSQVCATAEFAQFSSVFEKSWNYILKQFRANFEGEHLYPFLTNVLDTELCKKVFNVVRDTVMLGVLDKNEMI